MDEYLEVAEDHVAAIGDAFEAMAGYRDCSSGFSQLLANYNNMMSLRDKSHQKLHETWRSTTNKLGELASIVVDSDIFANFMAQEGCNSTLAHQTMQQAFEAAHAVDNLRERFDVGGFAFPD